MQFNPLTACPGLWELGKYRELHTQIYKKANPSDFFEWRKTHPDLPISQEGRWATIQYGKEKKIICLDPSSPYAGNIYWNDSKEVIYHKLLVSALFRPVHLVIKTLWHAILLDSLMIVIHGIYQNCINSKQAPSAEEIGKRIVRSLVDIVRTPIYDVALLMVTVAGLLAAPLQPELVYDIRALIGRLSRELNWGVRMPMGIGFLHDLTPCMQPDVNIMEFTLNEQSIEAGFAKMFSTPNASSIDQQVETFLQDPCQALLRA